MLNGWQQINGSWYYLGANGAMTRGWQAVNGRWYYMNGDGVMDAHDLFLIKQQAN